MMQHIIGIPRNQMVFSSLEDTILPENPVRFIDAFVDALSLETLGFSIQTLKAEGRPDEKLYIDIKSGSVPFDERPQGKLLVDPVNAGEVTYINFHAIDRAGKNTINVLQTLQFFLDKGVVVKIDNLGLESIINGKANTVFNLITTILSELSFIRKIITFRKTSSGNNSSAFARRVQRSRKRQARRNTREAHQNSKGHKIKPINVVKGLSKISQ